MTYLSKGPISKLLPFFLFLTFLTTASDLRGGTEEKDTVQPIKRIRVAVSISGIDVFAIVQDAAGGRPLPDKQEGHKVVETLQSLGFTASTSNLQSPDAILELQIKYAAIGVSYQPRGGGAVRRLYTGGEMSGSAKLRTSDRILAEITFSNVVCGVKPEVETIVDGTTGREVPTGYESPTSMRLWLVAEFYGIKKALTKEILRLLLSSDLIQLEKVTDYAKSGPNSIAREAAEELIRSRR